MVSTRNYVDTITLVAGIVMRQRACYPKAFKAQLVQECLQPGISVASVALRHGLNANLVRKWIPVYRDRLPATLPAFVPLSVQPVTQPAQQPPVRIDLSFGQQTLSVQWPSCAPDGCARLIRGLMA